MDRVPRSARLGAAAGAALGLITLLVASFVVFGTTGTEQISADELVSVYVVAAVFGVLGGAVWGALTGWVAQNVATNAIGDARARRRRGTIVAAVVAALPALLFAPVGPALPPILLLLTAVAAALTWRGLPSLVDLDTPSPRQPNAPGTPRKLGPVGRVIATLVATLLGSLLVTNVVMGLLSVLLDLSRSTGDALAFVVLAASAALIAWSSWRATA